MTKKPKQYEIQTLSDVFNIPEDRFDDFLIEFKDWYKTIKATVDLANTIAKAVGEQPLKGIKMIWIDDGDTKKTLTLRINGKPAFTVERTDAKKV